jgi:hypothetical protein
VRPRQAHFTPCPQKGQKKLLIIKQNTVLSSKAIKKYHKVFFWPFWGQGVICSCGITGPQEAVVVLSNYGAPPVRLVQNRRYPRWGC